MHTPEQTSTNSPLVDKLQTMEERWDEPLSSFDSPAEREWHQVHAERTSADLEASPECTFSREDLSRRIQDLDA